MFNRFRSFFALSRLPFRIHSRLSQDPNQNLYRVRFLRPVVTKHRLRSALFYTAATAIYWNVVRPVTQGDDEDVEEEDDEEEDDEAQWGDAVELSSEGTQGKQEGSMFVPLGFTRERPTKRYQPSDPEWKEFQSLVIDEDRSKKVRRKFVAMAALVYKMVMGVPELSKDLGENAKLSQWWIEINIPPEYSPGFERGGLEVTENHIIWTTRPVTPHTYSRLRQVLWPDSLGLSVWASCHALLNLEFQKLKSFFSTNSRNSSSGASLSTAAPHQIILQRNRKQLDEYLNRASFTSRLASRFKRLRETPRETSEATAQQANSSRGQSAITAVHPTPPLSGPSRELHTFISTFFGTLMHTWGSQYLISSAPPPGIVFLTGMVQIRGQNAWCTIDVRAGYNPKTNKVEGMPELGLRNMTIQGPKL